MNKCVRFIQGYLLCGFPFVVLLMVWQYFNFPHNGFYKTVETVLSINIMLWMFSLIIFLLLLVFVPSVRDKTLRRLANIRERDEREEFITGKAARAAYISTLSLMIFLFFISVFSVKLARISENQGVQNKPHWALMMNVGFQFFDHPKNLGAKEEVYFSTENFTPSKPAMILILMFWQLFVFNWVARKDD